MKKQALLCAIGLAIALSQLSLSPAVLSKKEELGRRLFFDPILSRDSSISCASCHKPAFAFADSVRFSNGVDGRPGSRNTPSAMNLLLRRDFFWDGRAASLEEQALMPIANPAEMDLPLDQAVQRLQRNGSYRNGFLQVFGELPNRANLAAAIAAFERTQETAESAFDRWRMKSDSSAVSEAAKRGFVLFNGKGKCNKCHFGADFTANEFRNIGLFDGGARNDSGRFLITRKYGDIGRFKTPSLRNVALTAPYMHDGQLKDLSAVISFYSDPGKLVPAAVNRDTLLAKPLGLSETEQADLRAFLLTLTDTRFMAVTR